MVQPSRYCSFKLQNILEERYFLNTIYLFTVDNNKHLRAHPFTVSIIRIERLSDRVLNTTTQSKGLTHSMNIHSMTYKHIAQATIARKI